MKKTKIDVNNKLKKMVSRLHIKALHIENDLVTMLHYNKKYTIKSIDKTKLVKPDHVIDYDIFEDIDIKNTIKHFVDTITKEFTEEELILFYRNISSLKIIKKDFDDSQYTSGKYDVVHNIIYVDDNRAIYHELFHVATTIISKKSEIVGFYQYNKTLDDGFGDCLNEGYTQLLTEEYFGKETEKADIYRYEVIVAKALEHIIGKDKLKRLYINADLNGLINELKKYNSTKEIINFINRLDFICNNRYEEKLNNFKQNEVMHYIKEINESLILMYAERLKEDRLSQREVDQFMSDYLDLFISDIALSDSLCNIDLLMDYTMSSSEKRKLKKRIYQ